jgi:hypothetical protein
MGFGLVIGFIDHLQIVATSNYSAVANSRTLQFTTARTNSSQSAVSSPGGFQRRRSLNFRFHVLTGRRLSKHDNKWQDNC